MTAHPNADLFAMTPADTAAMRAVARRQVQARIGIYAAPQPATEAALAQAMAESAAHDSAAELPRTGEVRQIEAATAVLNQLTEPCTAKQIAAALGKSENGVMNILRRLEGQSRVEVEGIGEQGARLWARTEKAYDKSAAAMARAAAGEKTRAAVLSALKKPRCAGKVAAKVGISRLYAAEILLKLYRAGKVTRTARAGCRPAIYARVTE